MSQGLTTKKRILVGLLTVLPLTALLILCWYYLPKYVFGLGLMGFLLLVTILEVIVKRYEESKSRGRERK